MFATNTVTTTQTTATVVSATGVQTSTSGTGGCVGSVDLTIDNGAPIHWGSDCFGTWAAQSSQYASGWQFFGGPAPPVHELKIAACENGGDLVASPGIQIAVTNAMSPGVYTDGLMGFRVGTGTVFSAATDPFKVTIASIGPIGGAIDGSFAILASMGSSSAHFLQGTFHVCHVADDVEPQGG